MKTPEQAAARAEYDARQAAWRAAAMARATASVAGKHNTGGRAATVAERAATAADNAVATWAAATLRPDGGQENEYRKRQNDEAHARAVAG